jgi:hypothetical protein
MINEAQPKGRIIVLDKYHPREYQLPLFDAVENKGFTRIMAILPRRAGKDVMCWNLAIRHLLRKPSVCYYIFPEYSQAKKAIWDTLTNDGMRFLDWIPEDLILSSNSQEMKIRFKNQSLLQLCGSDNYNSLMGTNPSLCIFSEFAMQDPMAWSYLRPILAGNNGIAIFISTPRGYNHMFQMYEQAKLDPFWYTMFMTVEDTQHMPPGSLEQERKEMPEDLFLQEYYCSFSLGIEGSVYSKAINNMRLKGQITSVPWESGFKVHTAWDIGRDTTAVIFFQSIGQSVRIIDYMEKANENLEYFIGRLEQKGYLYDKHFFPHDMRVKEWGGPKFTRIEKARQLGIKATVVDDVALDDGIEYALSNTSKIWIDEANCGQLIKCLENYRYEYDSKKQIYKRTPLHNWASHGADAFRYMCLSLPKTKDGISAQELTDRFNKAKYGTGSNLPPMFRDEPGLY